MPYTQYLGYRFGADQKDPAIGIAEDLFHEANARATERITYKEITKRTGGLASSTVGNWFKAPGLPHSTLRPQLASMVAFYRAIGCDLAVIKRDEKGNIRIIPLTRKGSPVLEQREADVLTFRRKASG